MEKRKDNRNSKITNDVSLRTTNFKKVLKIDPDGTFYNILSYKHDFASLEISKSSHIRYSNLRNNIGNLQRFDLAFNTYYFD